MEKSSDRSLIGQVIEWWGHNVISYVALFANFFPTAFLGRETKKLLWNVFQEHTKDVDLENEPDWWKFWEHNQ